MTASRPLEERFWEKVDKNGANGCWVWTAYKQPKGYGLIGKPHSKKTILAHRVSWELHNGPIPDGLFVCHDCPGGDNPSCVNPAHLWLGTQADNVADCERKQGGNHPKLEQHGRAKLTRNDAIKIRELYKTGKLSQTAIGQMFGVHQSTVGYIVRYQTWVLT